MRQGGAVTESQRESLQRRSGLHSTALRRTRLYAWHASAVPPSAAAVHLRLRVQQRAAVAVRRTCSAAVLLRGVGVLRVRVRVHMCRAILRVHVQRRDGGGGGRHGMQAARGTSEQPAGESGQEISDKRFPGRDLWKRVASSRGDVQKTEPYIRKINKVINPLGAFLSILPHPCLSYWAFNSFCVYSPPACI